MKRFLIVFGAFDVLTLIRGFAIKTGIVGSFTETQFQLLTAGKWTLYLSLVFSAYFLIRQSKIGIWLTYGQFPLRLLLMVYSFGFLLSVTDFFGGLGEGDQVLMWGFLGLEILRLVLTIKIHRKYYQ